MTRQRTPLPSSACRWMGHDPLQRIRQKLGVGEKMPATMHGEWNIDGWNIVVKRSFAKNDSQGRPIKTAKHRVFVRVDGELIPAGRVRQALCPDDRLDAKRRVHARMRREFVAKFNRMTEAEKIAHDAKAEGRPKKEVEAIRQQKQLAARRKRRR